MQNATTAVRGDFVTFTDPEGRRRIGPVVHGYTDPFTGDRFLEVRSSGRLLTVPDTDAEIVPVD